MTQMANAENFEAASNKLYIDSKLARIEFQMA